MNFSLLTLTFIAVNLDFFVILLFLLQKIPTYKVILGYLTGVLLLLTLSFFVGQFLQRFLPEWILGVLGFIPIYMAFKKDKDERVEVNMSGYWTVLITYLAVCSGCNLAIFLPVLVGETFPIFIETLLYLGILTIIIVLLVKLIAKNSYIQLLIERHGEFLMKICYILIGIYVLVDSGFIRHMLLMLNIR